ncbi:Chemotaxis protein CheC -- inhibitor of MCP methylation [hydrothermal vent metagenome]|uniref:Chemotaxis protein CheC -- inhibitor of MCP methylation n=1 Tax=hydrothermal vent metagenome TaxID=652676 RepID=A0A3B0X1C1_9ZZZZ
MSDIIKLSELEQDLLTELFNLGVGHAASALSTMVRQEIKLSVPQIEFLTIPGLADRLGNENSICCVSQSISGPFTAQSMLLFPEENSLEIVRQLMGEDLPDDTIAELQKEAFSEIGNIVLNACIGSFSNALNEEFKLDLPVFELSKSCDLLNASENTTDTALFIRINLTLSSSKITGYMAFLMGTLSLEQLKDILEKMLAQI